MTTGFITCSGIIEPAARMENTQSAARLGGLDDTPPHVVACSPRERDNSSAASSIRYGDSHDDVTRDVDMRLHADSDAVFRVSGCRPPRLFGVVASCAAAASPVWRRLLYGDDDDDDDDDGKGEAVAGARPRDGDGDRAWIVDIDADPQALCTLLLIAHYRFREVPPDMPRADLYSLTLLTSRLRCTHLVYPWARRWAAGFSAFAADDEACPAHCHEVAWIAWELGDAGLFRDMVRALVLGSRLDADGETLVNVLGQGLRDMILPEGILDLVSETRIATIERILDEVDAPVQALITGERDPGTRYCKISRCQAECETMLIGSALPALIRLGLYPSPGAAGFTGSAADLKTMLDSIKFTAYVGADWRPHLGHEQCDLGFSQSADRCIADMPLRLNDRHVEHLGAHAKMSGIPFGSGSTAGSDNTARSSDAQGNPCVQGRQHYHQGDISAEAS